MTWSENGQQWPFPENPRQIAKSYFFKNFIPPLKFDQIFWVISFTKKKKKKKKRKYVIKI